jgi:hypothetical protein
VGQQSGGQDILLNGFSQESVESAKIASNRDIGRADGENDERERGKKANNSLSLFLSLKKGRKAKNSRVKRENEFS